ncbi:MAG: hypothetical protein B7Y39_06215 [Bdellovibrio sp. 28-41-41]|nr:MAG: hypothetical protein B7Y39_06215 [Bdellovibrio sp. 28-41-41]
MKKNGLNKIVRLVMVALMAMPIPNMAFAASVQKEMVSASSVLNEMNVVALPANRQQQEREIRAFLQNDDVKAQLQAKGVSAEEMTSRLASLSDQEMNSMSTQIQQARAGGDLLIAILVIVLIIYFIKRI